jgi:predicted nucleotidyltransferase component of viral defense system
VTRTRNRQSPDSIRARLLDRAKREGEDYNRVLIRYANERVMYRLSRSTHSNAFILKGASLFAVWKVDLPRSTKDIDLLGSGSPDPLRLASVFRQVLSTQVEADGLIFDLETLHAKAIREEAVYDGVRLSFTGRLGTAELALQVDVGFGDAVEPGPESVVLPTLLDMAAPILRAYRREVVVAEKFHAMVMLGIVNSRLKDYFDVAYLASKFPFDGIALAQALVATFARRGTLLPQEPPVGITAEFATDAEKEKQWRSFLVNVHAGARQSLSACVAGVHAFVWPACAAISHGQPFVLTWQGDRWE